MMRSTSLSSRFWYADPVVCRTDETCREAYRRMLERPMPIKTGLPVVDPALRCVGFLPHPGGRTDY